MPKLVPDLKQSLAMRSVPTVVRWNRLEGRPRAKNFDRALRAEVRDALWMLTRQWQVGELEGDDAGSPVDAQIHLETGHLNRYVVGDHEEPHDDDTPLEARVECQRIELARGAGILHVDLRLQLGRQWRKLLETNGLGAYHAAYLARYPFTLPPHDRTPAAAAIYAHPEAWQDLAAIAGRSLDGGALYLAVTGGGAATADIALATTADGPLLDALGHTLVTWFDTLYMQPGAAPTAWRPEQLEHAFACRAPLGAVDKTLVADQYPGGHLDWYSFDVAANTTAAPDPQRAEAQSTFVASFLPAPVRFDGMPHPRWWKFEDGKVNLGDLSPATTDLGKLLVAEFALVYSNDWFLLPFRLPAGSLATIRGMTVTNTFNERFWIEAAGSGDANAWQSWRAFSSSTRGTALADTSMFLAPVVPKIQDGEPLEDVFFVRDEMANMVWGIETRVPLASGTARPGQEVARRTLAYHRDQIATSDAIPDVAPIHYQAMTPVAENWIPFVPVHTPGSTREIQLQRGRLLRTLDGDPLAPAPIEPSTPSLRRGFPTEPMFVHEEEIPRSGARLTRAFQRTRWRGGRTFVWFGAHKSTGRGEERSNLAFDQIATRHRMKL